VGERSESEASWIMGIEKSREAMGLEKEQKKLINIPNHTSRNDVEVIAALINTNWNDVLSNCLIERKNAYALYIIILQYI